jgi:peptidoglycan/xylan/chitin deacetylase (PgdA/CDA1 family)
VQAPSLRASRYAAVDIAAELRQLLSKGHEVGLHGIDAWHDLSKGREELDEISRFTGVREIGVRMHWLYFDNKSPCVLEKLGIDYDSTIGYNDAVGYRAGTVQVYKPLGASRLLELPLHIMDTALFSYRRQHLTESEARKLVQEIIDNAVSLGGVITINWHDRSIAPERLWRDFYVNLINDLKKKGAWLANGRDAVLWFRKRRMATFACDDSGAVVVNSREQTGMTLPGLGVRLHNHSPAYSTSQ